MDLLLSPMSPADLGRYIVTATAQYVEELVRSGTPEHEARDRAAAGITEAFPEGIASNGNEIFDVLDGNEPVGLLWLAPEASDSWYVMDIEIREGFRGRGYGRATMLLAEQAARAHGARYLGLNVFGHNPIARALYESLGYETLAVRMRKAL
jgi:ribosomal protein S18 acetylase RimI-like enzyme